MATHVSCFNPGPAKVPKSVLKKAQDEFTNFQSTGMSVVELSHRSKDYAEINSQCEDRLRKILDIPSNYKVLFMQGGGTGQFSCLPLNIRRGESPVFDYIVTGTWSSKAAAEAKKYGKVNMVFPKPEKFTSVADEKTWKLDPEASYVYYCANETVHGVEVLNPPDTGNVPLVCDMSSNFLTCKVDVSKYGAIVAGAQKNFGAAGVTVVIIRDDLLDTAHPMCPIVMEYKTTAANKSCYNTPPTFCIYLIGLVFEWILEQGGVEAMEKCSAAKSKQVYDLIDKSNFYWSPVDPKYRSRVNIPILLGSPSGNADIENLFVQKATEAGLIGLKGHRSVGGLRASLYNAVSEEDTDRLVKFMIQFEKESAN
ncbi:phosphoserine aminotransferase-like [Sycon ciliatum]|uniref:phosphoserine aminotransferase-like n=1 Tax=Sycon ciliatum TaxID=27933 RepID=UPI0020A8B839|eukprot:scpid65787/ scgid24521/ Phosphoserine aminotransferase; Phosphohydroxythreonine aminotransferase